MPVVKPVNSITDVMRPDEGNDSSLDTFIRDTIGKQPLLSFSRPNDNPVQWIQLLHALDQPDYPGWPLLTPLKVQMQKCSKCSREFCSSINYRRHLRVHHRLKRLDKDSAKNRDLLGAFWDKLSEDEGKEILSFKDVTFEVSPIDFVELVEVPGSSIIRSLTTVIRKPGISSLTQSCWRAGSTLLDLVQGRPSRFPLSSEQLFSILDDASEKTFLCGTAVLIQKYIFDGGAGKIGLETKNIVACTSFVVEQKLINAWLAEQDAEALRCQNLLVEEEEAAQRRQVELLERKRQKKLRLKEQKEKEQRLDDKVDDKECIEDTLEAVPQAEQSCPLAISDSDSLGSETLPDDVPSSLEPLQLPRTDEDFDLENHMGCGGGRSMLQGKSYRHVVVAQWHAPLKSQWNHLSYGFHANQNSHAPKPGTKQKHGNQRDFNFKPGTVMNGNRKWSRKPKPEYNGESLKDRVQKEVVTGLDHDKKGEVLIGSISVTLGDCSHDGGNNSDGVRDDCLVEHEILKKKNVQEKHYRPDLVQCGSSRSTVKLWRPVSRNGMKGQMIIENVSRECQHDSIDGKGEDQIFNDSSLRSCAMDNTFGGMENDSLPGRLLPGVMQFTSHEARAFLAERWKEAIAAEHVKLALPPGNQMATNHSLDISKHNDISSAENQSVDVEAQESSTSGADRAKYKTKPDNGVKLKYIPKQRTII
uniref:C2H2-type domain-containing protein n=1 Tax=Salix viminalis TaxID=40686 RepID=A0A6N2KC38_SALVM